MYQNPDNFSIEQRQALALARAKRRKAEAEESQLSLPMGDTSGLTPAQLQQKAIARAKAKMAQNRPDLSNTQIDAMFTPEAIESYIREDIERERADVNRRVEARNNVVRDGMRLMPGQGATFGFQDELAAPLAYGKVAVRSGLKKLMGQELDPTFDDPSIAAQDAVQQVRFATDVARQEAPVLSFAGEILGQVPAIALTGGAAFQKKGVELTGREAVKRGALLAAGEGALFGAGDATGDVVERLPETAFGGAVGGALGFAGGALFQRVAQAAKASKTGKSLDRHSKRAYNVAIRFLKDDLGGEKQAIDFLEDWSNRGADFQELVNKVGPSGRVFLSEIAGERLTPVTELISSVRRNQAQAVRNRLISLNGYGIKQSGALRTLKELREAQINPVMQEVAKGFAPSKVIQELADSRPAVKKALEKGTVAVKNRLGKVPEAEDAVSMDVLMRAASSLFDDATEAGRAGARNRAGDLQSARRALLAVMDEIDPRYAEARQQFADTKVIEEAMAKAKGFLRPSQSVDDVVTTIRNFDTQSEREFYLIGVADEIWERIGSTPDNSNSVRFIQNPNNREKIRALFSSLDDGQKQADNFINMLKSFDEEALALSQVDPFANSRTALRQDIRKNVDLASRGVLSEGASSLADGVRETGRRLFRGAVSEKRLKEIQAIRDELADMFFGGQGVSPKGVTKPISNAPVNPLSTQAVVPLAVAAPPEEN